MLVTVIVNVKNKEIKKKNVKLKKKRIFREETTSVLAGSQSRLLSW